MDLFLQVALDLVDLGKAVEIGRVAVEGGFDWVEAGTPLIKSEGIYSVGELRRNFPDNKIVADMKVVDAGGLEVEMAAEAGADIVSVLGAAADETVKEAVKASKRFGVEIMADLVAVRDPVGRVQELEKLGVDYVCVHTGIDQQGTGKDPLVDLESVVGSTGLPVAVAGGLNADTVPKAMKEGASIIVIGKAITGAENLKRAVKMIMDSARDRHE